MLQPKDIVEKFHEMLQLIMALITVTFNLGWASWNVSLFVLPFFIT